MGNRTLKPNEILESSVDLAESKAAGSFVKIAILGFLGGAFIAFAAEGSNMAAFNLLVSPSAYGLGRALAGMVFAVGLMLVILCGGELFTGNILMIGGVLRRRIRLRAMLLNWLVVYVTNFIGAAFIAWMISRSGLLHSGADLLGGVTVKIAAGKTGLPFLSAFLMGIMCNWLVCLAVWLGLGADSMAGKVLGIFFPIWLFVISGFEHSIANMYYIPAGIMAKGNSSFVSAALEAGASMDAIGALNWGNFLWVNLVPVTIGNIVGGAVFVSMAYLLAYRRDGITGAKRADKG